MQKLGRPRVHSSNAEKQKAYREKQKSVTKFQQEAIRNGDVDRIAIMRILRDGCVELTKTEMSDDIWFVRTEHFPYQSHLRGWYENEMEKSKWQQHLKRHIQSLLEPLGLKYSIFPSGHVFESCLVIAITLKVAS